MNLILKILIAAYVISLCSGCNKPCYKDKVINHTFTYLPESRVTGYFVLSDSVNTDFVEGKLYSKSKIIWKNCDEYLLIPQLVFDKGGVGVGDTLHVKIKNLKGDTLICLASAFKHTFEVRALRSVK